MWWFRLSRCTAIYLRYFLKGETCFWEVCCRKCWVGGWLRWMPDLTRSFWMDVALCCRFQEGLGKRFDLGHLWWLSASVGVTGQRPQRRVGPRRCGSRQSRGSGTGAGQFGGAFLTHLCWTTRVTVIPIFFSNMPSLEEEIHTQVILYFCIGNWWNTIERIKGNSQQCAVVTLRFVLKFFKIITVTMQQLQSKVRFAGNSSEKCFKNDCCNLEKASQESENV